jgi:hypothetical protein
MGLFKRKKENKGPFEANRILDTPQAKIDQVFTRKEEKPIALYTHTVEDEAKKIGVEGYTGTQFGGKGEYGQNKGWFTTAILFKKNLEDAGVQCDENFRSQLNNTLRTMGTLVPDNVQFKFIEDEATIPTTSGSSIQVSNNGSVQFKGSIPLSVPVEHPPNLPEQGRSVILCPNCRILIPENTVCPKCGQKS